MEDGSRLTMDANLPHHIVNGSAEAALEAALDAMEDEEEREPVAEGDDQDSGEDVDPEEACVFRMVDMSGLLVTMLPWGTNRRPSRFFYRAGSAELARHCQGPNLSGGSARSPTTK